MLASTAQMCRIARAHGFAVPAVNIVDSVSLRAVVAAAVDAESPAIIQVSVKTLRVMGIESITATFHEAAEKAPVPLAIHLDHCPDRAVISAVIAAGWSSVLFDASDRDLKAAIAETAEVAAEAHARGIDVESEIENIIGVEDGVGSDQAVHAYSTSMLVDAADRTGTDLLAPQLGTAHGMYKAEPVLLPDRVRDLLTQTDKPIVLHGGTGLQDDDYREFIAAGVSKINISTGLKHAYLDAARDYLTWAQANDRWDPLALFAAIGTGVQADIARYLPVFGSAGTAQLVEAGLK
ncbi:MAG: class II fructose-bisphosphate aldolase [Propionibacteriaceae bacterium]|jgi:fructose-bisphosphate aldolase class II|nr:class II fructose-bisphosphate aldolase [Propionibacteriaceae bacterium]